eukprot:Gb_36971 [translate_table: standard]
MVEFRTYLLCIVLINSASAFIAANPELEALLAFKRGIILNKSRVLSTWQPTSGNNPCMWNHIRCSHQHVTFVNLAGYGLIGTLAPEIGNLSFLEVLNISNNHLRGRIPRQIGKLSKLQILDLHNNSLSGCIPESLVNLTKLHLLNLSYNNLSGTVPRGGSFMNFSNSSFKGNRNLEFRTSSNNHKRHDGTRHILKPGPVAVVSLAAATITLLILGALIAWWRKPNSFSELTSIKSGLAYKHGQAPIKQYTIEEIREATAGFSESNVVGQSMHGIVYKALMGQGSVMAVKRMKFTGRKTRKLFQAGIGAILQASHKNVATVRGYCLTRREQILVYDYFPMGSLQALLHKQWQRESIFDWEKRKAVILGTAKGLCYLHGLNIVHGAVKASNILLLSDFTPKVTDYIMGHAVQFKLINCNSEKEWMNSCMAPELVGTGQATEKSDCYSFGFLLVEIISGKQPWQLLKSAVNSHLDLCEWVAASSKSERLQSILDMELRHIPLWEARKILELAIMCMDELPFRRPQMKDIVQFLVEEVLIANQSTELDALFIDLVMDSDYSGFHFQTSKLKEREHSDSIERSKTKVTSPLNVYKR